MLPLYILAFHGLFVRKIRSILCGTFFVCDNKDERPKEAFLIYFIFLLPKRQEKSYVKFSGFQNIDNFDVQDAPCSIED